MNLNKLKELAAKFAPFIVGVLGVLVLGKVVFAGSSFLDTVARYAGESIAEKLAGSGQLAYETMQNVAHSLGAAEVAPTYQTSPAQLDVLNRQDSGFYWGQLEVKGQSWLGNINATGTLNLAGTSSIGYSTTQPNIVTVAFNSNSTTLCSIQNTSPLTRVITNLYFDLTSTTGAGAGTQWRGYVSAGRADANAAATATVFTQAIIPIVNAANSPQIFGGPVPSSYYISSTVFLTGVTGITTTTMPLQLPNWYMNVTSTAITSSTGNCVYTYMSL